VGSYQPIKFRKSQYLFIKSVVRGNFGNVSIPKGLYIIVYLFLKYVPSEVKQFYRRKYYTKGKRSNL